METIGFQITQISSTSSAVLNINEIEDAIRPDTGFISVMDTNNETGLRYPIVEIAEFCKSRDILFHCDAVQSFGKFPLDLHKLKADLVSFSGHKIYGPKGIGLLFIREGTPFNSINFGGSQESNRRAGTENISGIIGLQAAVEQFNIDEDLKTVAQLQSYFETKLKENIPFAKIIGEKLPRSPYISAVSFPGYSSSSLLMNLDLAGIAASTGSACSSGSIEPSQVLLAMKVPEAIRKGALRFSFAPFTTFSELDYVLEQLLDIFEKIPNKAKYA
jgi:cysteine desulfurase